MESEKLTGKTLNEEGRVPNINSIEDKELKIKNNDRQIKVYLFIYWKINTVTPVEPIYMENIHFYM